jgi:hypothetical protein
VVTFFIAAGADGFALQSREVRHDLEVMRIVRGVSPSRTSVRRSEANWFALADVKAAAARPCRSEEKVVEVEDGGGDGLSRTHGNYV